MGRFVTALFSALAADTPRLVVFSVGVAGLIISVGLMAWAAWPTVQAAMAETPPSAGTGNPTILNNPTFNAPSQFGDHNTQIMTDPPAHFQAGRVEQVEGGVNIVFPIAGGHRWPGPVSLRVRLARPAAQYVVDPDAFFPPRDLGGVTISGGGWRNVFGSLPEGSNVTDINFNVDNTPAPTAKAVTIRLTGVTPADVIATEAKPDQADAAKVR